MAKITSQDNHKEQVIQEYQYNKNTEDAWFKLNNQINIR